LRGRERFAKPRLSFQPRRLVAQERLVLAARRSPLEATKAFIRTYWDTKVEVAAVIAVGNFIRAHSS
jgi:hypothetical protein